MQFLAILLGDNLETIGCHVIDSDHSSRGCIPEGSVIDRSPAEVVRLFIGKIVSVSGVQHSVGED